MPKAIEAMRRAFGQLSAGQATVPLRTRIATEKGVTLMMPAYLQDSRDLGIKIVSVYSENPPKGLPMVSAMVLVLDPDTGMPRAFLEGGALTAIRTGAAGGLAADLLARPDAHTVALFGAGVQGRAQLEGVMAVRTIKRINLIDINRAAAQKLAAELTHRRNDLKVIAASSPQEVLSDADIVITATTSTTPLFDGNDLMPGTHITGVGSFTAEMREVDETTVRRARVVVDSRETCLAEAGDIIIPKATIDAELGEIINGAKPGRRSDEEITFFKSVGVAVQDAMAAGVALEEAEKKELGICLDL